MPRHRVTRAVDAVDGIAEREEALRRRILAALRGYGGAPMIGPATTVSTAFRLREPRRLSWRPALAPAPAEAVFLARGAPDLPTPRQVIETAVAAPRVGHTRCAEENHADKKGRRRRPSRRRQTPTGRTRPPHVLISGRSAANRAHGISFALQGR